LSRNPFGIQEDQLALVNAGRRMLVLISEASLTFTQNVLRGFKGVLKCFKTYVSEH
jgi:hypothetical protein